MVFYFGSNNMAISSVDNVINHAVILLTDSTIFDKIALLLGAHNG